MSKTLELAKKLGHIRYRMLDGSSRTGEVGGDQRNSLTHLLVIDFESTCWEQKTGNPPPEIIEFPVVLLCLQSGQTLSEFHYYCQPIENPRLSPFCKQLTGISQDQVDDGVPLATCLVLFKQWLHSVTTQYNLSISGTRDGGTSDETRVVNRTTCVTWSDWDLSLCLENECKRKQIRKPDCFNSWIDIRAVYRNFYSRRPHGLNNALREVGLAFEGREHSGIEDARNTAKLIWKMVQSGCVLNITATRDENSLPGANTAHRMSTNKHEDDGGPNKRSKWKHFKPNPGPSMQTGNKTQTKIIDTFSIKKANASKLNNNPVISKPVQTESDISTPTSSKSKSDIIICDKTPVSKRLKLDSVNDSGYDSPQVLPATPQSAHVDGTPPLCHCSRRTRKRQVYKQGPNTGRIFWSCCLKGRNTKAGCDFFMWATKNSLFN